MNESREYELDISLMKIRDRKRKMKIRTERAAILFIVWLLVFKVFGIMRVTGNSMRPGYHSGDIVFFIRIIPEDVSYGDVIIVKDMQGEYLIKRVAGLPGDRVEMDREGHLVRNGEKIQETDILYGESETADCISYPYTVPEGNYFFLGDNRSVSVDSRILGTITEKEIKGRIIGVLRFGR